ncbi:MAG: hypothetical protein JXB05_08500 [Myxococcaceae bacterium]|nr:hypothetical protein [Myxococcaceae bacterium]
MRHRRFRGWGVLGGLAAAALLSVGCGWLPETGGRRQGDPPKDFFGGPVGHATPENVAPYQLRADRGFNGTISELGSSIDPRTPETQGTLGRSLQQDITGYMGREATELSGERAPTSLGIGGSGQMGQGSGTSDMGWRGRRGHPEAAPAHGSYDPRP